MSLPRVALLLAALATACGPGGYGDLGKPALVVVITEGGGFCSSVYAVDSDGDAWTSTACEGRDAALERSGRRVDAETRATLDAQMDEVLGLPDDAECAVPTATGRRFRFLRTRDGVDMPPDTRQCEPGVLLVATRLAEALEALGAPPIADAGP